nr:hypothetical protein [Micromonospora sp. DSM 115978]
YRVRVPNQPGGGGHVQVSAYGFAAARCKVVGWAPSGNDQLVDVRCFNPNGTVRDNMFTMTFARNTGVLRTTPAAYAWADQPASAVYLPSLAHQFNSAGGTNTVRRTGLGSYRVETFGQPLEAGTVNVTSAGPGNQHCKVGGWT